MKTKRNCVSEKELKRYMSFQQENPNNFKEVKASTVVNSFSKMQKELGLRLKVIKTLKSLP